MEAKLRHRVRFIDVRTREKLFSNCSENLLRVNQNRSVIFPPASCIHQSDQNALAASADGIVEVPGDSLSGEHGSYVSPVDLRKHRWHGLDGCYRDGIRRMKTREQDRTPIGEASIGIVAEQTIISVPGAVPRLTNCRTCRQDIWPSLTRVGHSR